MAPKNTFHGIEIRSLRAANEELEREIAKLKMALASANTKDETDMEAIIKKTKNECWLEYRKKESTLTETIAELKEELVIMKKKNSMLEERTDQWKGIAEKASGPAKVHQELRQEKAEHARTKEELRKLKNRYESTLTTVQTITTTNSKTMEEYEMENKYLRDNLTKKEVSVKEMSDQVNNFRLIIAQQCNTIDNLNTQAMRKESAIMRHIYAKTTELTVNYPIPDIAPILRDMISKGQIPLIIRVNQQEYDLVVTQDVCNWAVFNNIAAKMGVNMDKILVNMHVHDNQYAVFMTETTPINISF